MGLFLLEFHYWFALASIFYIIKKKKKKKSISLIIQARPLKSMLCFGAVQHSDGVCLVPHNHIHSFISSNFYDWLSHAFKSLDPKTFPPVTLSPLTACFVLNSWGPKNRPGMLFVSTGLPYLYPPPPSVQFLPEFWLHRYDHAIRS